MPNTFGAIQKYGVVTAGEFTGEPAVEDADPQDIVDQLLDAGDVNLLTDAEYTFFLGIYSLTPSNDDILQRKAGAWVNRTVAQYKIDLALNLVNNTADLDKPISDLTQDALDLKQNLNTALTQISGLSPVQGDVLYHNGSSWVILPAGTSGFSLKTQGAGANPIWSPGGMGDALTSLTLAQFAPTNSAQLAGVISDETGYSAGALLVFNKSPVLITPDLGTPSALIGTNITGTGAGFTAGLVTDIGSLTGHVISTNRATTIANSVVTEDMQVLADNTTNNASITKHGYLKKLPNDATFFMNGVGDWLATVANDLTASTTVAPSKSAVNTALDLKANLAGATFSGIVDVEASGSTPIRSADTRPFATDNGGGLLMAGVYNSSGDMTTFASLHATKENSVDGEFGGGLSFRTRLNGGDNEERVRISSTGIVSLLQGQLKFPATQNPSADANTLDDYEEGTFTPGFSFGGASVGIAYTAQTGTYTKKGNEVTAKIWVDITSKGSSTGAFAITGLPFTSGATATTYSSVYFGYSLGISYTGTKEGYMAPSGTTININQISEAGGFSAMTDVNVANTSSMMVTITYTV